MEMSWCGELVEKLKQVGPDLGPSLQGCSVGQRSKVADDLLANRACRPTFLARSDLGDLILVKPITVKLNSSSNRAGPSPTSLSTSDIETQFRAKPTSLDRIEIIIGKCDP